jgi:hypothetical protein
MEYTLAKPATLEGLDELTNLKLCLPKTRRRVKSMSGFAGPFLCLDITREPWENLVTYSQQEDVQGEGEALGRLVEGRETRAVVARLTTVLNSQNAKLENTKNIGWFSHTLDLHA